MANNPPRRIDIRGQDHMLAYITPEEGGILQLLGGSGAPGPMGIPSFYGPDGPGHDGTDPSDTSVDDVGTEEDPGPSFSGVNVGGGYNSNTISNAMAASSPTGIGAGFGTSGSTNMGLDDSIADMANAMAGHTAGTTGYGNVQGSINYAPFGPGFFNSFKNRHARSSLTHGYAPEFGHPDKDGNPTSITGKGSAGFGIPGLGPIGIGMMIGTGMGAVTTSGGPQNEDDIGGAFGENDLPPLLSTGRYNQMPTNPYEDEDPVIGKSLPINRNEPYETTQQSPLLNAQEIQDQFGLSQGLDYTRNPFAGMSIQDQQTLGSDKEVMGIASLNPLEAENIFANVSEENMAGQRFIDSSEDIEDIAQRIKGLS